ncbi:MAG: glycoside hydrolase domain-containing protein, partial [Stackebrandtia sp.]
MSRSPARSRRRWLVAGTAAAAIAAATAVTLPALADTASARTVDFHGYAVDVPQSWRVVDLDADPTACVRFDTPAIYFGTVGDMSQCPSRVVGSTSGVLIQPMNEATASATNDDTVVIPDGAVTADQLADDSVQLAVEEAGVLVSAVDSFGSDSATTTVLESARLTDGGTPTAISQSDTDADIAADPIVAPGTYNDKAFDACTAQSQSTMDAWKADSPYSAVGIYV